MAGCAWRPYCTIALAALWLLAGCGGGGGADPTPPQEPPLRLESIARTWNFTTYVGPQRVAVDGDDPVTNQSGGEVQDGIDLPGPPFSFHFAQPLPSRSAIYSSASGMTYWAYSVAPSTPRTADSPRAAKAEFEQVQAFRKIADDATLTYVLTVASQVVYDFNTDPAEAGDCPWEVVYREETLWVPIPGTSRLGPGGTIKVPDQVYAICSASIVADVDFLISARHRRRWLAGIEGSSELGGTREQWSWLYDDYFGGSSARSFEAVNVSEEPLFIANDARVTLLQPIVIEVPLDDVPIGGEIHVRSWLRTHAANHRQRESGAAALLRDPGGATGTEVRFTGLEPLPVTAATPWVEPEDPVPPCPGAPEPERGTIAFERAEYEALENPGLGARITLVRGGGSAGTVSVQFDTADGSAVAGADYDAVHRRVHFADGQSRRTVHVPLRADAVMEDPKTLGLSLSDARGCAALGTQVTATLRIVDDDHPLPPPPSYTVGGTVTGLGAGTLVLEDRAQFVDVSIGADGRFAFARLYRDGNSYDVQVKQQPTSPPQLCTVSAGQGNVAGTVENIVVSCEAPPPSAGLDTSFGGGTGLSTAGPAGIARAIALQSDGRIVAAIGSRVARYLVDGTLDTSFGDNGIVSGVLASGSDEITDLAVMPDGRIVVVGPARGSAVSALAFDFGVRRLAADGSIDASFNGGEVVRIDWIGGPDHAKRVLLQSDGRIVVVGIATTVLTPTTDDAAMGVVRLNADGGLDTGFGSGGRAAVEFAQLDFGYAAALQPDGKIVVAGRVSRNRSDESDVGVARLNADGTPDTGFGSSGTALIDLSPNWDEAVDVVVQPDGKLVLAVAYSVVGDFAFGLLRLNADGSRDGAFGSDGLVFTRFGTSSDSPTALALQADGGIVVAGSTIQPTTSFDFVVARFGADGVLDAGFGDAGHLRLDLFANRDGAFDVLVQPDGRLLVSGFSRNGSLNLPLLVRLHP